jgi:uncharacterized protein YndB with AHSA1/START domain
MKHSNPPIVVAQEYAVPVERLWRAITDRDEMVRWFFDNIPSFEARVGFETAFDVTSGERVFPHRWRVTRVEAPTFIAYEWSYAGYPGLAVVEWEVEATGDGIRLALTNRVVEDFQQDVPEFRRESCVGGWEYFLKGRLRGYLGGGK